MAAFPPKSAYPRRQTLDLRLSLAAALARLLRDLEFDSDGRAFSFARVFDEWASWTDANVSPSACVLPDEQMSYADARMTPTLLEDTWVPAGQPGWGLYALADAECDLVINIRAPSPGERTAIVSVVEDAFVEDRVTGNYEVGARYGRLLTLDEYFGVQARFSLKSSRVLDDGETAMRNFNEATFTISAQTQQVKVDRVVPFLARVTEVVDQ